MVAWPGTGGSEGTWNDEMKAYVDVEHNANGTHKFAGAPVTVDSESNAMLLNHAYLVQTAGFVGAVNTNKQASLYGWIDNTSNPSGAGTQVHAATGEDAQADYGVYFFVPNGYYFEITDNGASSVPSITWTPLITGGAAPIDQD